MCLCKARLTARKGKRRWQQVVSQSQTELWLRKARQQARCAMAIFVASPFTRRGMPVRLPRLGWNCLFDLLLRIGAGNPQPQATRTWCRSHTVDPVDGPVKCALGLGGCSASLNVRGLLLNQRFAHNAQCWKTS